MGTWLVTGGTGFLGRHLLAALAYGPPDGARVVALGRRQPPDWPADRFTRADLDDLPALTRAVADLEPDVVLHAAGRTPPADPPALYRANTRGTVHLLSSLRATGRAVRVVLAGSAAELGPVPVEWLPVGEDHPCRPADAYGLSKWFASYAGLAAAPPLEVIVARAFNPIGPGLPTSQAFGRFARLLAAPGPDPIRLDVGDLEARRDFIDVRDVASALLALLTHGRPGRVYHVGSGRSRRVGDGLDALIGLSGRRVEVHPGETTRRGPSDSRADIARITAETPWVPRIAWEQSLADLWAEARASGAVARQVA